MKPRILRLFLNPDNWAQPFIDFPGDFTVEEFDETMRTEIADDTGVIFHVSVLTSRPHVIFFGAESDCIVAEYVHKFLAATCRRHLREFEKARSRKASEAIRKNFVAGWFYGIHHQLDGAEEQLILEDSRLAIVAADQERRREEFRDLRYKTKRVVLAKVRRNEGALMSGFRRGRETQIRPAVNDAQRPLRLT